MEQLFHCSSPRDEFGLPDVYRGYPVLYRMRTFGTYSAISQESTVNLGSAFEQAPGESASSFAKALWQSSSVSWRSV